MATQKDFDFTGATLRAEIERVALSKRAKAFLSAIADLARDRQSYEGSLATIAEMMNASYQTARRAKLELIELGVITTIEPPGKAWTWSIDWNRLMDLPTAPRSNNKPRRSPPRRRNPTPEPEPVFLRPEIPRALLSLITLWTWLFGKERTPSTPSTLEGLHPLQMGAPTSAPPPLLSATPSTSDVDPLHFDAQPPPNGRAQVRNPLQMGAPTPPDIDINDHTNTNIDIDMSQDSKKRKERSPWGYQIEIEPAHLRDLENCLAEIKKLRGIGFFEGIANAEELYVAFRIHLRNYLYRPKKPGQSQKIPVELLYGKAMHSGRWVDEHTSDELEEARSILAKLRRRSPVVAAGGGRREDSAAHLR